MNKSPSVFIREVDASSYTVTDASTILAIVGYASKGPINKAVMVNSKNDFIEKFGLIPEDSPYGHLAAHRAFNQTNQLIYYRVADGAVAAERVVGVIGKRIPAYAELNTILNIFEVTQAGEYTVTVTLGEGVTETIAVTLEEGLVTLADLLDLLNQEAEEVAFKMVGGKPRIIASLKYDTIEVEDTPSESNLIGVSFLGEVGEEENAVDPDSYEDQVIIRAKEKGSSTNLISVVKTSSYNPVTKKDIHYIDVLFSGNSVERFEVSLNQEDSNYFGKILGNDNLNGKSEWIEIEVEKTSLGDEVNFANGTYLLGTKERDEDVVFVEDDTSEDSWRTGDYTYREGLDGIKTPGDSLFLEALDIGGDLANEELFDYHILITPDNTSPLVQDKAIMLAEARQDFIYIADPPMNLKYQQVTDWHNGEGDLGRDAALNSSFVATYWSWTKEFNPLTKEYVWVPPSVNIAELYLSVDRSTGPWAAPAGDVRGRIITSDIERSPSLRERDVLYGDINAVNPIVMFSGRGVIVYGQKTTYRENSAVNRVNIRRTLIYIKKLIKRAMTGLIFEPHTPTSWNNATHSITNILGVIKANGGIDDFSVAINENTNTQNLIAQGVMRGIITIVPVGTIERIELDIKFLSPGATITE